MVKTPSSVERLLVQRNVDLFFVLVHRFWPIKVGRHPRDLHPLEVLGLLVEKLHGLPQRLLHLVNRQVSNVEACCDVHSRRDIHHRVDEPTGGCNHWEGTILLADHLRQAAGLVPRRHQEDVAACHHLMLHLGVETDVAAHALAVRVLHVPQHVAMATLAIAHHDQLASPCNAIACVVHQPRDGLSQNIHTFLPCQTTHEADHANVRVLVHVEESLQSELVCPLAGQVVADGEVVGHVRVHLGIPAVVDAVEDALDAVGLRLRPDEIL
mmetsp:Transcript_36065/g.109015  ORF Transcript_36065/g.109015 Transcript_36065/m.109015 type:complete len:268 (+) Transcript_36065:211-1014(+)